MAEHRQPVTKKQHYVPQHLLRHFASGGSERINAFRITCDKLLRNQSVREQPHQNHFHGEQAIEKCLGSVEAAAAPVIAGAIDREALGRSVGVERRMCRHLQGIAGNTLQRVKSVDRSKQLV